MRRMRIAGLVAVAVMAAMGAAGCGDDNPTGPSRDPLVVNFSGSVGAGGFVSHNLTSDRRGIATATLTWGTNAVDLDLIATGASCSTNPQFCAWRAGSVTENTTSERLVFGIVENETLKLFVQNFSGAGQNYTISVSIE